MNIFLRCCHTVFCMILFTMCRHKEFAEHCCQICILYISVAVSQHDTGYIYRMWSVSGWFVRSWKWLLCNLCSVSQTFSNVASVFLNLTLGSSCVYLAAIYFIAATCVLKMPLNPNHPSIHPVSIWLRNWIPLSRKYTLTLCTNFRLACLLWICLLMGPFFSKSD